MIAGGSFGGLRVFTKMLSLECDTPALPVFFGATRLLVLSILICLPSMTRAQAPAGKIVFSSDRDENVDIYVMNANGRDVTRLTRHVAADFWPSFSRDGNSIVFVSERAGNETHDIYVMGADGAAVRQITGGGEAPTFHPNGDRILFSADGRLFLVSTNAGAVPQEITITGQHSIVWIEEPVFSPNGNRIAFAGWTEIETPPGSGIFVINSDIYVMNSNGSGLSRLTTHDAWDTAPNFSQDGARITFARQDDPSGGIYVVPVGGGTARRVTPASDWLHATPAFSPDDTRIVFSAAADFGYFDIYTIHTNGTGLAPLTEEGLADNREPSWGPGFVPPTLTMALSTNSVIEGTGTTTNLLVTLTLSSASTNMVRVTVSTINDSAIAGSDFIGVTQVVAFTPGQLARTLTVTVLGDSDHEPTERFFIDLTAAQNASISLPRAEVSIVNDDPIPFRLGRIAFSSRVDGNEDIFVMEPDGSQVYNLTGTPNVDERMPVWSPDGTRLLFVGADETNFYTDIYVINADGTARRNITNTPDSPEYYPSWSPDGMQLAYESTTPEFDYEIFIMNVTGGARRMLTNAASIWPVPHRAPVWSSTGKIYFIQASYSDWSLRSVDADGRNAQALVSVSNAFFEMIAGPAVSADGSRLAFMQGFASGPFEEPQYDIMLVNADGSGLVNLTQHLADDVDPTFSPDGTKVIFTSLREGNYDVYSLPVPGSAPVVSSPVAAQRWTTTDHDEQDLDWDNRSLPALKVTRSGQNMLLRFTAAANRTYTVQFRSDVASGAWQRLRDVAAQSMARPIEIADLLPPGASRRFYRVVSPASP